jgi:hypothetical protein
MSSTTSARSGKETTLTADDLAKRFAIMEEPLRPLQPLADTVIVLTAEVAEQGHQQEALNLALLRVKQSLLCTGATPSAPPASNIDKQMETQGDIGGSNSVASPPTPHR